MYEDFYRLNERPFALGPDAGFVYWSETHSLALTVLRYGLMTRSPITVITGEIGAGKTTLLRHLLSETLGDVEVGLISNMQANRGELLHWILASLGHAVTEEPYVKLFARLQNHIVDVYAAGKRVVLIFDEAQNLNVSTLEELRMLSNINTDKDELIQLVLVGQPQLRDLLNDPALVQFAQRISADFHLEVLKEAEAIEYIHHRMTSAGAQWRVFDAAACQAIYAATRGVPRLINILCDLCLVYGYAAGRHVVGVDLVTEFLRGARRRNIYTQFTTDDAQSRLLRQI